MERQQEPRRPAPCIQQVLMQVSVGFFFFPQEPQWVGSMNSCRKKSPDLDQKPDLCFRLLG